VHRFVAAERWQTDRWGQGGLNQDVKLDLVARAYGVLTGLLLAPNARRAAWLANLSNFRCNPSNGETHAEGLFKFLSKKPTIFLDICRKILQSVGVLYELALEMAR
jgi:hypothetical protein